MGKERDEFKKLTKEDLLRIAESEGNAPLRPPEQPIQPRQIQEQPIRPREQPIQPRQIQEQPIRPREQRRWSWGKIVLVSLVIIILLYLIIKLL